jgi:aminomethyltransferase
LSDSGELRQTALHGLHVELGAKMVPFAGYSMPVQYPAGVLKEHLHTRAATGLFDVSHMGQVFLSPRSGNIADAAVALEALVPVDVLALKPGRQRYGLFTAEDGGILDDLMITNLGDRLFLVVNASRKGDDLALLRQALATSCEVTEVADRALLAMQGPGAEAVLTALGAQVGDMKFMDVRQMVVAGAETIISRSGYTGEDGFEISVPATQAEALARTILRQRDVLPIGLGARDSLRLEAGLCLYGNDIDTGTSPVEAALEWAIQKSRRIGGAREGGFPGADTILHELEHGSVSRRTGIQPEGRAPIRDGALLFATEDAPTAVGRISSGGFGPSLGRPVAMGYVPAGLDEPDMLFYAELRGRREPVRVATLPFVEHHYKRL